MLTLLGRLFHRSSPPQYYQEMRDYKATLASYSQTKELPNSWYDTKKDLKALDNDPRASGIDCTLAGDMCFRFSKVPDKGINFYTKAIKKGIRNSKLYYRLGILCLKKHDKTHQQGSLEDARQCAKLAISLRPNSNDSERIEMLLSHIYRNCSYPNTKEALDSGYHKLKKGVILS